MGELLSIRSDTKRNEAQKSLYLKPFEYLPDVWKDVGAQSILPKDIHTAQQKRI